MLLAIGIELLSDYHSKSPWNRIIAMSDTNETYGAHLMKARPRLRIEITVDTSETLRTESEKRHAFDQKVNGPALDAFFNVQDSLDIYVYIVRVSVVSRNTDQEQTNSESFLYTIQVHYTGNMFNGRKWPVISYIISHLS